MSTKVTLIIDNPSDVDTLEAAVPSMLEAAAQIPKIVRIESGKVWPKEDGSPTPAHRTIDMYFETYDDASAAVASPEGGEFFGQLASAGGTFTGLFTDVER
ncbi:hypothetical protein [Curtobacterium sp. MCBA15_008]|uniref:hypothetical protein n=1 Tax=Curtobacterium sp. MCBA15_008 TaxID=1898736 RepID=UPI0008DC9A95|nr:hypothetical protein [Curtobacterium sp. MCBA15_008]OII06926.1 hypothetical protein BIU96_04965 [Curtobacterium sp. MCBA15_008]